MRRGGSRTGRGRQRGLGSGREGGPMSIFSNEKSPLKRVLVRCPSAPLSTTCEPGAFCSTIVVWPTSSPRPTLASSNPYARPAGACTPFGLGRANDVNGGPLALLEDLALHALDALRLWKQDPMCYHLPLQSCLQLVMLEHQFVVLVKQYRSH